jgi:hypothetical protein
MLKALAHSAGAVFEEAFGTFRSVLVSDLSLFSSGLHLAQGDEEGFGGSGF